MLTPSARILVLCLGLLLTAGCVAYIPAPAHAPAPAPPPPPPEPEPPAYGGGVSVDVGYFHDALDPWGDWVWAAPHGWVWVPGAVDPFWRPYSVGRWAWSDYGWTWVSDEDWGWATYHYGRWARLPRHGWAWVPGDVWGPAWVAWRNGPGVVGWAPLPPGVGFRAGVGLDFGNVDIDVVIRPDWWCFVDEVRVIEPRIVRYAYPVGRNVTVIRRTTRIVRIDHREGRVFHGGIPRDHVERAVRRPLPHYRVVDRDDDGRREEIRQNEIRVWRRPVRETRDDRTPRRAFGKPQDAPGQRGPDATRNAREEREPAPLPPAAPTVERRIERGWEKEWRRTQESRSKAAGREPGAPVGTPDTPAAAHAPAPPAQAPPASAGRSTTPHASAPPASAGSTPPAASAPLAGPARGKGVRRMQPPVEQERDENMQAAETAYQEQQAQRARAQREAEKPRPKPAQPERKVRGSKGKGKEKDQERDKEEGKD